MLTELQLSIRTSSKFVDDEKLPNPFASPVAAASIPEFDPDTEIREFNFGMSLLKWMVVCAVSAGPSFFIAFLGTNQVWVRSSAMVFGILTYVAMYLYIESREWTRRKLMDKSLRIAVKTGFITRVAISVLFPIGFFVDMICGLISVSLISSLFDLHMMPMGSEIDRVSDVGILMTFIWYYTTTMLQGLLLNIVLGGYTLVVYAIVLLARSGRSQKPKVLQSNR